MGEQEGRAGERRREDAKRGDEGEREEEGEGVRRKRYSTYVYI